MASDAGKVLATHGYALGLRSNSICTCGFAPTVDPDALLSQQDHHQAHLAAVLEAEVIRPREREAWVKGFESDYEGDGWAPNPFVEPFWTCGDGHTNPVSNVEQRCPQCDRGGPGV